MHDLPIESADVAEEPFSVPSVPSVVSVFQPYPVVSAKKLDHRRQRSFSDESPTRTSIMVMIQKRTTTWFSFQPFNS